MVFTIELETDKIKKIQPFCGSFIDIVCTNNFAIFCSETGQCFVQVPMSLIGTYTEEIPKVRIETNVFCNAMVDGVVKFFISDSDVQVVFYGVSHEHEFKLIVPRQVSAIDVIDKNRLLTKSGVCADYSLSKLQRLIRLVSRTKSPFIIFNSFAFMYYKGTYVFQKTDLPSLCCDSDLLKRCVNLTYTFNICEDYLIFKDNDISVFIHKQKTPNVCDLDFISRTKASRELSVDVSKASNLLSKLKANDYEIRMNIDSRVCVVKWNTNRFEIPLNILSDSNNKSLDDALSDLGSFDTLDVGVKDNNDSEFIVPYWVIKLLEKAPRVKIYITKRFYLLNVDKIFITINKVRS